jgi:FixJ family two-component response regulator
VNAVVDVVKDVPIIAIVDDDASIRRSLLRVVQSAGYKAEAFASAREFLDWLPRNQAACLVLDAHMNEMNGFDLQNRLTVPIIFITAHHDASTLERIEKSGAAGLLRKPFGAAALLEAIRRAVRANHERNAGADGGGPAPAVTVSVDEGGG